jgi:hypothetical protein
MIVKTSFYGLGGMGKFVFILVRNREELGVVLQQHITSGIIDAISIETPFFFYKLKTKIKQLGSEKTQRIKSKICSREGIQQLHSMRIRSES